MVGALAEHLASMISNMVASDRSVNLELNRSSMKSTGVLVSFRLKYRADFSDFRMTSRSASWKSP